MGSSNSDFAKVIITLKDFGLNHKILIENPGQKNNLGIALIKGQCYKTFYGRSLWLHHPLDGVTNSGYKLLHFIQLTKFFCKEKKALAFNWDRCCHLELCLWLILFHSISFNLPSFTNFTYACLV
jgi:hypothetical protein